MKQLILIYIVITAFVNIGFSQDYSIKSSYPCIIKNGFIKSYKSEAFPYYNPTNEIIVLSKTDSIINSIEEGFVNKVKQENDSLYLVIIKKSDFYFVYDHIKEIKIKEGTNLEIGTEIGIAEYNTIEHAYLVGFTLWKGIDKLKFDPIFKCP